MAKVNDYLKAHNYIMIEGILMLNDDTGELINWFYDYDEAEEHIEKLASGNEEA